MTTFAQMHAEGCTVELSSAGDRVNLVTSVSWVGESLYATSDSLYDGVVEDAILIWYYQFVDFDYGTNTCAPDQICGHYTQVIIFVFVAITNYRAYPHE